MIELAFVAVSGRPGSRERVAILLSDLGAVIQGEHSAGWLVHIDPQATKILASHPDVAIAGGVQVPALRRVRKVVQGTTGE